MYFPIGHDFTQIEPSAYLLFEQAVQVVESGHAVHDLSTVEQLVQSDPSAKVPTGHESKQVDLYL